MRQHHRNDWNRQNYCGQNPSRKYEEEQTTPRNVLIWNRDKNFIRGHLHLVTKVRHTGIVKPSIGHRDGFNFILIFLPNMPTFITIIRNTTQTQIENWQNQWPLFIKDTRIMKSKNYWERKTMEHSIGFWDKERTWEENLIKTKKCMQLSHSTAPMLTLWWGAEGETEREEPERVFKLKQFI